MSEPLLAVEHIETRYGLSQVLFGISLAISAGEMVTLMGRNGMGKTTTVRSIMGLTPATAGSIRFGGQEIASLPSFRVAKLGIGLVPEGRQIFPNLTTRENLVATAANFGKASDPWTLDKVLELFPRLGERLSSMGNLLSGGEQQMLAIGRALMTNPRLLDSRRGDRGARAADPRRDLGVPDAAQSRRPVDPGDRQERRGADENRRPALHHRARQGGVAGHLGGIGRRAGRAAPVSRDLTISFAS